MNINIVKHLPANTSGRDFVMGDLHGCRALADQLLQEVNFNPAVDRLFLVGDLADRGPDSIGCLNLLRESWCHSVMGNHEELLMGGTWCETHPGTPFPNLFFADNQENIEGCLMLNGGMWVVDHFPMTDELFDLIDHVAQLPQIIVVGEGDSRFNIVHAELPMDYTDKVIDELPASADINDYDGGVHFRWSRSIMGKKNTDSLPEFKAGLSKTYTGHTVVESIKKAHSHICLDTGAFLCYKKIKERGELTMIEPATGLIFSASPTVQQEEPDDESVRASLF